MELGGPRRATVGHLLQLYAHQFTLNKYGCAAELTRINNYLVGAGLAPLKRLAIDGRYQMEPKQGAIGANTPSGLLPHLDRRRAKRQKTFQLIREIGATTCAALTTSKLRELATTMRAEGLSESTVQKEVALLKAAFNVASREWGWRGFINPAIGIRLGQSRHRFVRLTPEEEQRLVDALAACDQPEFWPLAELAITSTMRRGSLLAMEWRNVSLENREVHVWAKGREVTLPLSARAVELLRRVPRNDTGRVFTMSANAVKMAWARVRRRALLPHLRFADLRHLGATFYAKAGLNPHQLRLVLGHTTTKMAEVYVNLVNSDVVAALDSAEAARPASRPLPSSDYHVGCEVAKVVAERRAERLNGRKPLPTNVYPLKRRPK
jgi:integrase